MKIRFFSPLLATFVLIFQVITTLTWATLAWAEIEIEIRPTSTGEEEVLVRFNDPNLSNYSRAFGTVTEMPEGTSLYHWGSPEFANYILGKGHLDAQDVQALVNSPDKMYAGGGYYASLDAWDSRDFGPSVLKSTIKRPQKGLRTSPNDFSSQFFSDRKIPVYLKIEVQNKLRAKGIHYLWYSPTWVNFISHEPLASITPATASDIVSAKSFERITGLSHLENLGFDWTKSPEALKKFPEAARIANNQPLPKDRREWLLSELKYDVTPPSRSFRNYFKADFLAEVQREIAKSGWDSKSGANYYKLDAALRTGRNYGLSFAEMTPELRPRPKVNLTEAYGADSGRELFTRQNIATLDPFGQKLARSLEFIDYNDLMLELAQGRTEPWRRYDTAGTRPLLDRWQDALQMNGVTADTEQALLQINKTLSGNPNADIRDTRVIGGGDIMVNGKGYYRIAAHEKSALEANPLLTVDIIPDPTATPPGTRFLARHEYPSAFTYKKFSKLLSTPLVAELEAAERANTLDQPGLTKKVLTQLLEQHGSETTSSDAAKYQDYVSIHPFSDYNGRTLRAHYQRKTGTPLFLRDFDHDLFLNKEAFTAAAINGEEQLYVLRERLLQEHAKNPAHPKYYDLPDFWRLAIESEVMPGGEAQLPRLVQDAKAWYLDPANQHLIQHKMSFDIDRDIRIKCVTRRLRELIQATGG